MPLWVSQGWCRNVFICICVNGTRLASTVIWGILGYSAVKFKVESDPLVDQIDAILPQTQCGQCGYPGCKPYAEAIANGDEINKCPPGGEATIKKLADLMGVEPKPLDSAHGVEDVKKIAYIREAECIIALNAFKLVQWMP